MTATASRPEPGREGERTGEKKGETKGGKDCFENGIGGATPLLKGEFFLNRFAASKG